MEKVKGALLKFFVKGIRANKSGIYETILSEEDLKVVHSRILDAAWYPFITFKNCFNAVVKVFAKGDMKIVYKMGYNAGTETIKRLYQGPMMKREISDAIASYNNLFKLWFDFGKQYGEIVSKNEVNVFIEDFDSEFEAFYYVASGWMTSFFENYLKIKVSTKFVEKSWEGAKRTVFNIKWDS